MKHIKLFEQFINEKIKKRDWSPEEAKEWAARYNKFIGKKIKAPKFIQADELINDVRYDRKVKNATTDKEWFRLIGIELEHEKAVPGYPYDAVTSVHFIFETPWLFTPWSEIKSEWKGEPYKITAKSPYKPEEHHAGIEDQWVYKQNPEKYLPNKKFYTEKFKISDMSRRKEIKMLDMMFGLKPHPMNWEEPEKTFNVLKNPGEDE